MNEIYKKLTTIELNKLKFEKKFQIQISIFQKSIFQNISKNHIFFLKS